MQRYEREIEEILRRLERDELPGLRNAQSESPTDMSDKKVALRSRSIPDSHRPPRSTAETVVLGVCLMLMSALILLPFGYIVPTVLIALALALLLVALKRTHFARQVQDDHAANDLRWVDVTAQARSGSSSRPRKPDDSYNFE
jgi:hypothetical protein